MYFVRFGILLSLCCSMEPTPKKSKLSPVLEWQIWFINNYEFNDGAVTTVSSILRHAASEKENMQTEMSSSILGKIVKHVYGHRVEVAKKGQRHSRFYVYQNLKFKKPQPVLCNAIHQSLINKIENMPLDQGWVFMKDSTQNASLIFSTSYEFNAHRLMHEIRIKEESSELILQIKSGGRCLDIDAGFPLAIHEHSSQLEKIKSLMHFIKTSSICKGFMEMNVNSPSTIPHVKGLYRDLAEGQNEETRVISQDCLIFCPSFYGAKLCKNCYNLSRQQGKKENREVNSTSTSNRWLTREQLLEKLKNETRRRKSAVSRENYWKEKFEEQQIEMEEKDSHDIGLIFDGIDDDKVPPDMKCLWEQQLKIRQTKSEKGYRWHPKIIRLCLDLYCKNPHVLDSLREFVTLPSQRTIRLYKSKIDQRPGWNPQLLKWCWEEAKKQGLQENDHWGGFIIDEMKVQENLEMTYEKGKHKLVGFVFLGQNHNNMSILSGNEEPQCQLAQQVLQFIFLSDRGFRFPIAQYPSANCTPSDLYFIFWEGVRMMYEYDFTIYWCILDGAEVNRQFIKIHFENSPSENNFVSHNIITGEPMVFIVDCKHNIKKIRNNITKSNKDSKPRCLILKGKKIMWSQLYDAFIWDQKNHTLPVHEKLTLQHFQLDPATKMRNSLAEDVLDAKMLYLLQAYKTSMGEKGDELDSAINLLQNTSTIVSIFTDHHHITHVKDHRLMQLMNIYNFFKDWKEKSSHEKQFISSKLWFDLQSMVLGFIALVKIKLAKFPSTVLKPAIVNQDCVENHFCQIRACNGQNNNPTYKLQQSCQNSIIFGQTTISRKSNAGKQTILMSSKKASLTPT